MSKRNRPTSGLPPVPPGPAPAAKGWSLPMLATLLQTMAQDDVAAARRPFKSPALPHGVVPPGAKFALDSASAISNYGFLNNGGMFCGMGFPGYAYLSELAQRSEYRAPTETIAKEMTREWVHFTGTTDAKLKELEQVYEDMNIQACFRDCASYDGFFGRGQLAINIKGQESDQRRKLPLMIDDEGKTVGKGQLLGFKPIEPIWTTPYLYNSLDPMRPDFYKPQAWYIMGKQTHSSRLLTFVSRPLPDMLKPAYNFGGMSLSQLIEPYVNRWLKGVDGVSRLITNYSTSGIKTNLATLLEGDASGGGVLKRAQLFNQMRDNRGVLVLDKDTEEFFQFNVPLSGLADLLAQLQEHMAAPTHIPLVKLTGITPEGLNASSEGEIKVFYDFIEAEQEDLFNPHMQTVLKLVQLHLWGKVDPKIKVEWVPLDSPTDKERAEMTDSRAKAGVSYVTGGVISPDEERQRLRNDPDSGYGFITGDAPATPLEQEHALGEEGKDADAERGEEGKQADHERSKEAAEHAAEQTIRVEKAKPKPGKK